MLIGWFVGCYTMVLLQCRRSPQLPQHPQVHVLALQRLGAAAAAAAAAVGTGSNQTDHSHPNRLPALCCTVSPAAVPAAAAAEGAGANAGHAPGDQAAGAMRTLKRVHVYLYGGFQSGGLGGVLDTHQETKRQGGMFIQVQSHDYFDVGTRTRRPSARCGLHLYFACLERMRCLMNGCETAKQTQRQGHRGMQFFLAFGCELRFACMWLQPTCGLPTHAAQVDDLLAYQEGRGREAELGQQLESIGGAQDNVSAWRAGGTVHAWAGSNGSKLCRSKGHLRRSDQVRHECQLASTI